MSGKTQPMITPEHATKLLDEVVYERVLGFLDLDGLYQFEQELWCALGASGVADEDVAEQANAMIVRALARIADDPRRCTALGGGSPLGFDCPDCLEDARLVKQRGS